MSFLGLAVDVVAAAVVLDVAGHFVCSHCGTRYRSRESAYRHVKTHRRRRKS
jgi:hypothetical protein